RPARTEVFANMLVRDLSAHRHVLIGTNLSGLRRGLSAVLGRYLDEIDPMRDLPEDPGEARRVARSRSASAFAPILVVTETAADLSRDADALGLTLPCEADVERLLVPGAKEPHQAARRAILAALAPADPREGGRFVTSMLAAQRTLRSVDAVLGAHCPSRP